MRASDYLGGTQSTRDVRFKVKLYGHMASDDHEFCQKLSSILGVDESTGDGLLRSVPIVIREGLKASQATRLSEMLTSAGALCLVEPSEGFADVQITGVQWSAYAPVPETPDRPAAAEGSFLDVWASVILAALGGFILIFATASIWNSYMRVNEKFPTVESKSLVTVSQQEHAPSPVTSVSLASLRYETEEVESNLEHLRFVADLKFQEMSAISGAYRADRNMVRERRVEWEGARAEVDAETRKLRELKEAIRKVESQISPYTERR